jgi:hypothetical protein
MKPFNTLKNFSATLVTLVALTTFSQVPGMADSTVINPDTAPVAVKSMLPLSGTEYAFQYQFAFNIDEGKVDSLPTPFYVPPGKRLVIEHMSIEATSILQNGKISQDLMFGAWVTNTTAKGLHNLTIHAGTTNNIFFQTTSGDVGPVSSYGGASIRLYVGANEPMAVLVRRSTGTGVTTGYVVVNGHFEPAP